MLRLTARLSRWITIYKEVKESVGMYICTTDVVKSNSRIELEPPKKVTSHEYVYQYAAARKLRST